MKPMFRNPFTAATVVSLGLVLSSLNPLMAQKTGSRIRTIIVDAGHGGSDPGAKGRYSTEAQLTLKLSLRLELMLKEALPDTRIVMTRTTDIFHNVREKADIANREKGDLFVCVHVNAAPPIRNKELSHYKTVTYYTGSGKKRKKQTRQEPVYRYWTTPNPAKGTSSYIFAADRGDEKGEAVLQEQQRYESQAEVVDVPDPNSPEAKIMARLWSQKYFKNSVRLGTLVEEEFVKVGRKSAGVLQRNHMGIWVLQATNMPAVLIETGFITNPDEEDYLNSDKGQEEIARSIANAVLRYKAQMDNIQTSRPDSSYSSTSQAPGTAQPNGGLNAGAAPSPVESRSRKVVQTLEVSEPTVRVELYDNGQIDEDTVSLYLNNRPVLVRKRLSTVPIIVDLKLERDGRENELVMHAENMGTIPPNTALMVVTVKDKRYEFVIESTKEANGTVRFRFR
jgi:N-acetylmuramoyl-L-alanine amidase